MDVASWLSRDCKRSIRDPRAPSEVDPGAVGLLGSKDAEEFLTDLGGFLRTVPEALLGIMVSRLCLCRCAPKACRSSAQLLFRRRL